MPLCHVAGLKACVAERRSKCDEVSVGFVTLRQSENAPWLCIWSLFGQKSGF
jgi:hypothetical protein